MAADSNQTVGDLRRKAIVTDDEITAATDAYLADSKGGPFRFGSGHKLDLGKAVDAHRPAKAAVAEKGMKEAYRRTMIRTAIICGADRVVTDELRGRLLNALRSVAVSPAGSGLTRIRRPCRRWSRWGWWRNGCFYATDGRGSSRKKGRKAAREYGTGEDQ